tara:strand:- start:2334 stop:2708 length:375 start_codon:yes stop_codon:yes gene_type:complete
MNDYAVIKTGGKQYLVEKGTLLNIEKIEGKPGEKVSFNDVLLTSLSGKVNIGKPIVKNSSVVGEIKSQFKGPKIKGIRYKNKTRHSVRTGHRQQLTSVEIKELSKASTKVKTVSKSKKDNKDGS